MKSCILVLTLSCLFLEETTHVLAQKVVKRLQKKTKDIKEQDPVEECSALRNEANKLETSNRAL